jgi:hypothetical protein
MTENSVIAPPCIKILVVLEGGIPAIYSNQLNIEIDVIDLDAYDDDEVDEDQIDNIESFLVEGNVDSSRYPFSIY